MDIQSRGVTQNTSYFNNIVVNATSSSGLSGVSSDTSYALIAVVVSLGIVDIQSRGVTQNTSYFNNIVVNATSSSGLSGVSSDTSYALSSEGVSDSTTEQSFIVRGSLALLKVGKALATFGKVVDDSASELSIPAEMVTIVIGVMTVCLAIAIYMFWRGRIGW